jgi:toxin ParE1/3/4
MMWRLTVSPAAERDLVAIESFLADQASPVVAARQVDRVVEQIDRIADNPLAYARRADLGDEYRLAVVKPYVVIFRCQEPAVRILRVVHGARDLLALRLGG